MDARGLVEDSTMKRSKTKTKVTAREWFYLCCLGIGGAVAILGTAVLSSRPPKPDHPPSWLEAPGVVPWYTLSKVSFVLRDGKATLQFGEGVQALDGKEVQLRGYVTPLQLGTGQKHFLLSTKPPSCAFCIPAGPDETVEVFCKTPVKFSAEPVTVAGTFAVLANDPGGLFYRMADAVPVSVKRL
jgi:uncharacterized protein